LLRPYSLALSGEPLHALQLPDMNFAHFSYTPVTPLLTETFEPITDTEEIVGGASPVTTPHWDETITSNLSQRGRKQSCGGKPIRAFW
jgi:hypothetical protein